MELFFNRNPQLTKWLVGSGALHEPFVVVDVGVQGGENPRWHFLGDHLVFHGFDAIREVIDDLQRQNAGSPTKTFHHCAIGDEDGEREFLFNPTNPTNSSFYPSEASQQQARLVPIRRLDTLLAEGVIPKADFLKVDVEGFEKHVFLGAQELLAAGVLGVECETSFATSVVYPATHFGLIHGLLLHHGLVAFDLSCDRFPRAAYHAARAKRSLPALPPQGSGKPAAFEVLFCRDVVCERNDSLFFATPPPRASVDQLLKMMVIYESHGYSDIAVDTAVAFAAELGQRIDVERAIDLLCRQTDLAVEPVAQVLKQVYASTSWRITAPLRALGKALRRSG